MTGHLRALTHVGLITDDIERTAALWRRLLGFGRVGRRPTWHAVEEGVLSTFLTIPGGVVEPIQATADNVYRQAYESGRRAYHISVQVNDIRDVVRDLRAAGLWVQLRKPGEVVTVHRGWIDPDSTGGLPIELIDTSEMAEFVSVEELAALVPDQTTGEAEPVLRWTAIGHLVRDLDAVFEIFTGALGFTAVEDSSTSLLGDQVRTRRVRLESGPAVEIAQPVDSTSIASRRLETAGPGIGYLRLEGADYMAVAAALNDQEAWLTDADNLGSGVWLHARSTDGLPVLLTAGQRQV